MASIEDVANLRGDLQRLRQEVEAQVNAEQGAREEWQRELRAEIEENFLRGQPNTEEFYEYLASN